MKPIISVTGRPENAPSVAIRWHEFELFQNGDGLVLVVRLVSERLEGKHPDNPFERRFPCRQWSDVERVITVEFDPLEGVTLPPDVDSPRIQKRRRTIIDAVTNDFSRRAKVILSHTGNNAAAE